MYKMLVVDDESLMRKHLKNNVPLINSQWYVAGEAIDGQEALNHLRQQHFDLVLTDIKMPEMDGLELIRIISEEYPKQKVVILSGYDEFNFAKEAIRNGVCDYLLKPVISEELETILIKVTHYLDNEKKKETAYKTLVNLSEDARHQVVKNFLKAVVSDSNTEIKALYPLIHRLKVSLIESEGIIMLIELNEEDILEKSIPVSDISIFKFILSQIVTEISEEEKYGIPFFDHKGNVAIHLTGENMDEINEKSLSLYSKVSSAMFDNTGITITCTKGTPVNDILQLNISYNEAYLALINHLKASGNTFVDTCENEQIRDFSNKIHTVISLIKSAILDNNEANMHIGVNNYMNLMWGDSVSALYKYGIFLIKSIASLKQENNNDLIYSSMDFLYKQVSHKPEKYLKEDVIKIYLDVLKRMVALPKAKENRSSEMGIVEKAKKFIYEHFSEPISLALIADNIGVSSSYLSDLFHKSVGESYIKFLTRIRMDQATKLLRTTPAKKICDVAENVGYVSVKHFSYIFKQHYSSTPGEYQQQFLNSLK